MSQPKDPLNPPENPEHKLQLWISDELFNRMGDAFPHGMKRPVFTKLAEDILELMQKTKNPDAVCAAILTGALALGKEFDKEGLR